MLIELSLMASMFFTGYTTLGVIVAALYIFGISCGVIIGKNGRKDKELKKISLLFSIPALFIYLYYITQIVIALR